MTAKVPATAAEAPKNSGSSNRHLMTIGVLFFVFGFVTWLGSVLVPYLRIACQLNNLESYFVAFYFYISYCIFALPSAKLLEKTGYRNGMTIGMAAMVAGVLLFIPAAIHRQYMIFLTGLFIQGCGLTILQTAANPYVVVLGPPESAARRISLMGICNGVAGILAPALLGHFILDDISGIQKRLDQLTGAERVAQLDILSRQVIWPYSIMAIGLTLMAIYIFNSGLPEIDPKDADAAEGLTVPDEAYQENPSPVSAAFKRKTSVFHFPHLLVGACVLFLYVGVEVIAVDTIISYGSSQGISLSTAKFFASCTLAGMLTGYGIGFFCIPRFFSQSQALVISAVCGIAFAIAALLTKSYVSVAFIALLGLANSMVWPSLWPLALAGLGRFTKAGASLLIMAICGGAVLPLLYGRMADAFSPHLAYALTLPCYAAILFYGLKGHKIRRT